MQVNQKVVITEGDKKLTGKIVFVDDNVYMVKVDGTVGEVQSFKKSMVSPLDVGELILLRDKLMATNKSLYQQERITVQSTISDIQEQIQFLDHAKFMPLGCAYVSALNAKYTIKRANCSGIFNLFVGDHVAFNGTMGECVNNANLLIGKK